MTTRKCKQCGKSFTMTDSEINYFLEKGLQLPKRCKECRTAAKEKENATAVYCVKSGIPNGLKKMIAGLASAVVLILGGLGLINYLDYAPPVSTSYSESERDISNSYDTVTAQSTNVSPETTTEQITTASPEIERDIANSHDTVTDQSTNVSPETTTEQITTESTASPVEDVKRYYFRNNDSRDDHFVKHGKEMGFTNPKEYESAASKVINSPDVLHKLEKEDNDDVYYLESTNEFVIVSTDGYIRTYFNPDDGKEYFDRQ